MVTSLNLASKSQVTASDSEAGIKRRSSIMKVLPDRGHVGYPFIKRSLDIFVASVALTLLSPTIAIVWLALRITLREPALFKQLRLGHREQPFTLLKFRTMRTLVNSEKHLLADSERLTPFGQFLRRTSIDEIPQLWNVVRGDMSLIGPRPLLPEYLPRYSAVQRRRHEVKPGLTGWAQVNGRNSISWEEKFNLDVWYVDHWSPALDMKIFFLTLIKVLQQEGTSQAGHVTMQEFMGSTEACQRQHD